MPKKIWKGSLLATANDLLPYGLTKVQVIRICKASLGALICFVLCIIPVVKNQLGSEEYLLSLMAVGMNGGRRVGAMVELIVTAILGLGFGIAYAAFGRYFATLIETNTDNVTKSLAFLSVMEVIILMFIGFTRSIAPRLHMFAFVVFLIVHFSFLSDLDVPLSEWAYGFSVPMLLSFGISLFINLTIFPEFGSTFLGTTVLDSLNEIHNHMNSTIDYFINFTNTEPAKALSALQKQRTLIRKKVALSKSVLTESTFEMTYSYMAPKELKPAVKLLVRASASTSAIVGACELEYALLGEDHDEKMAQDTDNHGLSREIAHADADVLTRFLNSIHDEVVSLSKAISLSMNCIKLALSYGYDVPDHLIKLIQDEDFLGNRGNIESQISNEGSNKINIETIDEALKFLVLTIAKYDDSIPQRLESAAIFESNQENILHEDNDSSPILLPRDEYFLVSSFLLNFREFANITSNLLSNCREIVDNRTKRESKGFFGRSLWFFPVSSKKILRKYLWTGVDDKEMDVTSIHTHKLSRESDDSENWKPTEPTTFTRLRNILADIIEFPSRYSFHFKYAFKYTILLMLVSFPAFSASMRTWYVDIKGTWIGFVAHLVIESSIGATAKVFLVRAVGLILGSVWAYVAWEAGWSGTTVGGYAVMCVVIVIGFVIGFYYMMLSPYPKAALIGIVSITIVILSVVYPVGSSSMSINFAKRCIAMLIGGAAALIVQVTIFPVKARVELVKSIASCLEYCEGLEGTIAQGIEGKTSSYASTQVAYLQLQKLWKQAGKTLALAESYRKYSLQL